MSLPLLKTTFKKNWPLLAIFSGILLFYSLIMIFIYDPVDMDKLQSMLAVMPTELLKAMGMDSVFTNLTGYLASWLYGLLMTVFPLVYSIILGGALVVKTVDSGSVVCLLSLPVSRVKIISTKAFYAVCSLIVMQTVLFFSIWIIASSTFSGSLDAVAFFRLNFTTLLANTAVMSIIFFFSCLFNSAKYAFALGAGIPLFSLLLKMLGGASDSLKVLKNISIFGWYDPVRLVNGTATFLVNLVYLGISAALITGAIFIFKNKRLPV